MNALAIGDAFKQLNQDVRVQTGVEMRQIAEYYIKDRANEGEDVVSFIKLMVPVEGLFSENHLRALC